MGWPSAPGRVTDLIFRWESDSARASAEVMILASDGLAGPFGGMCGLFALPFPGPSEILQPFGPFGR